MSVQEQISWDGRSHSYRPDPEWRQRVAAKLAFHDEVAADLDPISYEVLRNRFWTINMSHGETITRISGSPIFQALDFCMSILTEDADMVVCAPFVQYLNSGASFAARYTMEHFSESPGIEDGDVFLSTDPWIGAIHQMDVCLSYPVFVEGRLFAWVSNAGHQYDLGGIVPGGWPQNAPDVYSDPIVLTPVKLVERGEMRRDLEQTYLRQSRMPDLVALDLRAQIAGCRLAAQRIAETCEEFGAATVKAAMRRVLEQGRQTLVKKLSAVPDGRWSEIRHLDENMPGDRNSYPIQLNVEKRGDRLRIDNEGTDEQLLGPIGFTYLGFEGGINAMVSVMLLYEQTFAIGAAIEQLEFAPAPGKLNCLDHPAAVSGGIFGIVTHMNQMCAILSKMLVGAESQDRGDLLAPCAEFPMIVLTGTTDRGQYFGTALMDAGGLAGGARGDRDGVDTGGPTCSPLMRLPDVEVTERFYPLVYLHRRQLTDSGGAGRWRGGRGLEYAVTPYRATALEVVTNTGGTSVSTINAPGLFGGYPSPTSRFEVIRETDLSDRFARREIPRDLAQLDCSERKRLRGKSNSEPLNPGDVLVATAVGGGGYGDPLDREPERVAADLRNGAFSAEVVARIFGVALDEDGEADAAATAAARRAIREERASWPPAPAAEGRGEGQVAAATGEPPRLVHEHVVARDTDGERRLACARCDHDLGGYHGNYRLGLLMDEGPVEQLPLVGDPSYFVDADVVLRRFCCPGCQVLMAAEVAWAEYPVLDEMRLA